MKGTYVFAVAFLASWTVITASEEELAQPDGKVETFPQWEPVYTKCPYPEKAWNITTNLAHETNCEMYYKCHVGTGVRQNCPYLDKTKTRRLHYNILEQVCDWPWRAGCTSCPTQENGSYLPLTKIAHESSDCSLYYECVNGVKSHPQRCPNQMCFSRTCQKCVWDSRGGICDGVYPPPLPPPTPSPTPSPPPPPPPPPTRPPIRLCRDGARQSHFCHCGKFYECYDEDWYVKECDGGLHFNTETEKCLPANEANCKLKN